MVEPFEPERPPPLPELQEADLDESQLGAYLDELHLRVPNLRIGVKDSAREQFRLIEGTPSLAQLFAERSIWGAQLHYDWDGRTWLDTLIQKPTGVRLVRMAQ